jgi:hypothetical protein
LEPSSLPPLPELELELLDDELEEEPPFLPLLGFSLDPSDFSFSEASDDSEDSFSEDSDLLSSLLLLLELELDIVLAVEEDTELVLVEFFSADSMDSELELEEDRGDLGASIKGNGTNSGLTARAANTPAPPVRTKSEIPVRRAFFCANDSTCCNGVI